jgi:Flp pilus assembly protein TadG
MSRSRTERGAVAVEMAILLPVLILLLFGMLEFGRALNTQATLNHAAREGVRVMAITKISSDAQDKAVSSAPTLNPLINKADVHVIGSCPTSSISAPTLITVTIDYQLSTLTGIAGPFAMKAKGVMLCGG